MKQISMVVTDLDGTLFYDRENITDRDRTCIEHLRASNIPLVLATGRETRLIYPALERLELMDVPRYLIYAGGCGIVDMETGEDAPIAIMQPETLRDIYEQYHHICGMSFMISQDNVLYTDHMTEILENESRLLSCDIVEVSDFRSILTQPNGKLILCGELPKIEAALPTLLADNDPRYQFHRCNDNYIDCYARGVNKGAALRVLCARMGIDPAQVLAVGDNLNDTDMLEVAGYSACPGDGHPAVFEQVDYVACPAYKGAVADACEHFIFSQM